MTLTRLYLALGALLVLHSCTPGAPEADLAIRNVTVIDAANGVREVRSVVVNDGRIAAVQAGALPAPRRHEYP